MMVKRISPLEINMYEYIYRDVNQSVRKNVEMKSSLIRSIRPLVKEYASERLKHEDQKGVSGSSYGYAVAAIVHGSDELKIKRTAFENTYCFASLNADSVKEPKAILVQVQPCFPDLNIDAYRHYMEWVVNFSPWRHAFVTKSINKIMKECVVIVDPTTQGGTMMGALQAIRDAWENHGGNGRYKQLNFWWELVSKGANPVYAYAMVSNLILINDDRITKGSNNTNHSPIGYLNVAPTNFVLNRMKDDSKPWSEQRRASSSKMWASENNQEFDKLLFSVLNKSMQKGKVVNPFNNNALSYWDKDKALDCLINEIPNMEKELNAA